MEKRDASGRQGPGFRRGGRAGTSTLWALAALLPCLAWGQPVASGRLAVALDFELEEGRHYQIERTPDLISWAAVGDPLVGEGVTRTLYIRPEDQLRIFYRARQLSGQWVLVWADEFEGEDIDRSKWMNDVNANGGGNNELQYYTDEPGNSFVENGLLVLQAKKEPYSGLDGSRSYTSAKLTSKFRGAWRYGRVEARARLPIGQGIWPAIWMLPRDSVYGGWAASGEIDIVELVGHEPATVHGTIHYGGQWPQNASQGRSYTLESGTFNDGFHTFAIEWEEGEIRWYVDGELYQTLNSWHSTGGDFPAPFDQPFYLILNVAVGGNWPGNPDNSTPFPARMEVDYVRVYQWAE